jgi:hypothetical protein
MNKKEVAIRNYNIDKPQEIVKMAVTLKDYVVKQNLYSNIKGKNYAHVEGWQFAGFLSGLNAVVESEENLSNGSEVKWKAIVHIYRGEKRVSRGVAVCSSKESSKKGFDEYAILSMAQTRAIGKAYRNLLGWVMKLAGYEATPSEEMQKYGETPSSPAKPGPDGDMVYTCEKGDEIITKQEHDYSMKMFGKALCREHQKGVKRK